MADTNVPALGKVNKPTLYIAGIAGVGAVVYAYYRKKKAAAAAASAVPAATTAYGYAAAGYGYGELTDEEQGIPAGYAYGDQYGYGIGSYGVGTSEPSTLTPVSTNAEWAQYAQQFLVNQGYTGTTVAQALGAYITGSNVGDNESIVQAAIAFEGYPPVAGSSGYPPNINTGGSNSGQSGGGGGTTTATTTAKSASAISNLTIVKKSGTSAVAKWNPATGATGGYKWVLSGPVTKSGTTKSTNVTITGLKAGKYNFGIQALPGGAGNNEQVTI